MIITDIDKLRVKSIDTSVEECKSKFVFYHLLRELTANPLGIGLGAIQIGIPLRAAVITTKNETLSMINPVIIEQKHLTQFPGEGCLSLPGVYVTTERYNSIIVEWLDYNSQSKKEALLRGRDAIAVQHEIDHFEGILMIDKEVIKRDRKISRNDPCPVCRAQGKTVKWKKCKEHNSSV